MLARKLDRLRHLRVSRCRCGAPTVADIDEQKGEEQEEWDDDPTEIGEERAHGNILYVGVREQEGPEYRPLLMLLSETPNHEVIGYSSGNPPGGLRFKQSKQI